jgi:tetratricopeptide (TPR) repeat protein
MGLFLLLLVVSGAPTADDVSQAKVHFQAGKAHYQLGNFSDAIREFAAGYALTQSPDFLINLGQAYRAQGETAKALDMFDKYLEKAPADAPARKQVEALAASLREKEAPPPAPPQDAPVRAAEAPPRSAGARARAGRAAGRAPREHARVGHSGRGRRGHRRGRRRSGDRRLAHAQLCVSTFSRVSRPA